MRRKANRIALTISSLEGGGAERAIANLSRALTQTGRAVTVITMSDPGSDFYSLDSRVERIAIGIFPAVRLDRRARNRVAMPFQLRAALKACRPDVVLSFIDRMNILTLAAAVGLDVPVVVSERVDPRRYNPGPTCTALRPLLYPRAAALVVQTQAVVGWAARLVGPDKVRVIPGAVIRPAARPMPAGLVADGPLLVAIGRLSREKGFDLLLDAFARCSATRPGWRLLILGKGRERAALEAQAVKLGLGGRVRFGGMVEDVYAYLNRAEAFVLSSRFEGFPNVVLEAMAAGRPVVAFACDSGPAEILRHEEDGLLVPPENVVELVAALERVMDDPALRARLGAAAEQSVERFTMERVLPRWDRVLEEAAGG